jgi:uncharacterized LabA/DUF88 family protein
MNMDTIKQRVIVYVDGYNFYYGLKANNWKKFYWLDMVKFCDSFMGNNQELIMVKYFSAPTNNSDKYARQNKFFSANKANNRFELILGNYMLKDINCRKCKSVFQIPEEKKTDVNIATQLISDCVYEKCDISILISGDSDLTPPIDFIKSHNAKHKITVFFPPNRVGSHLKGIAHNSLNLDQYKQKFKTYQLPDEVELKSGYLIKKPTTWC